MHIRDGEIMHDTLTSQAATLSNGTLATITGLRSYTDLDEVQRCFVLWCDADTDQEQPWQDAWARFCPHYQAEQEVRDHARQLQRLAQQIDSAAAQEHARVTRERLRAEWCTKRQPTKTQAEPVGLFEQRQETLDF